MEKLSFSCFDFPDTIPVRDGYDVSDVPASSQKNFELLVERFNQLCSYVQVLADNCDSVDFDW